MDRQYIINYLKYAQHLGVNLEKIKVSLPSRTSEQIAHVDELLSNLDTSKPLVVIAPATTWANKHWQKENWKVVVENIKEKCNIVFTGGPNDNELIEFINEGRYTNLAGKTDIMELMEVFSRANLVISPDSGSAHLAWATGKPAIITIFTCTPKEVLAPFGNKDKYVALGGEGLHCQPCFKRKCHLRKTINACTKFPNPKEVLEEIERLIF
jgi:heptosyltransferase-1